MADWCIQCARPCAVLDPATGFCVICTEKARNEAQRMADEDELLRLEEEARLKEVMRERDAIKKARQRMREEFGANPRKR